MKIDNNTTMSAASVEQAKTSAGSKAEAGETKEKAASASGSGITVKASELNLGEDLVEEKRKKAQSAALKLMMDAFGKDAKMDKEQVDRSEHAKTLLEENQEYRGMISDIQKEKEITNELYGVNEESEEWKELELLRKGRDAGVDIESVLTEEELAQYRGIQERGLTDYQNRMLELDGHEKTYQDQITQNESDIIGDYATIRGMKIERLKYHDMLDAVKQGDKIKETASKEIVGMLIDQVKDNIDEDFEEKKEEALEKKEEKEELEERIEKAKADKAEKEDDHDEMYEYNNILDEVRSMNSKNAVEEAKKSLNLIVSELQLTAEDVKGIVVDRQA